MGLYKVTGPTPVLDNAPGQVFEHDFTADDEYGLLAHGRLALEPRPYRVIGPNAMNLDGVETLPGGEFSAALTVGQEAALIESAAIERLPLKSTKKPAKQSADNPKE